MNFDVEKDFKKSGVQTRDAERARDLAEAARAIAEKARAIAEKARRAAELARDDIEQSMVELSTVGDELYLAHLDLESQLEATREALADMGKERDALDLRVKKGAEDLAKVNQVLRDFAERLARSNAELQDFAFVASHDLQEPLRKIIAFGNRLRAGFKDTLGEEGLDYLTRMQNAAARMSGLLQALLEYSRIATRAKPPEFIELTRVAQDAASDLELAIENADAELEIGPLPSLEADPHQMRRLFQNLIDNSLKYHREDRKPRIRIHGLVEDGVGKIFVEDNGIGFDEKYLDRIFQPLQRLHGRSAYQGVGMGLAICKKLVERHRGTITARSAPGEGATFIVTLPVRQISNTASEEE